MTGCSIFRNSSIILSGLRASIAVTHSYPFLCALGTSYSFFQYSYTEKISLVCRRQGFIHDFDLGGGGGQDDSRMIVACESVYAY